jgi:hypothetical protein
MTDLFLIYLLSAFLTGGAWVAISTIIAERLGSRLGGFVIGLPSTTVVSFLFIGLSQSPQVASQATTVFPLIYGFTGIMLAFYAILSRSHRFSISISASIAAWFILAIAAVAINASFAESLVGYLILTTFSLYLLKPAAGKNQKNRNMVSNTKMQLLSRAAFSGAIVAAAVLASYYGGPILGGAFAAFPASFIAGLIIIDKTSGIGFSRAMAKSMALSGLTTSVAYGIAVRFLYAPAGLLYGTIAAYTVSIIIAVPIYYIIRKFW